MKKLEESISKITKVLDLQEKHQDKVLQLTREIIRDCAKAIKDIHGESIPAAEAELEQIRKKISELGKVDADFKHISQQCYQEFVEIESLMAIFKKKDLPGYEELGVEFVPWLLGLADTVGELRRALQLSLRSGKKKEAEYYFNKMNGIYDNLMTLKYSSSLVGPLRRKQDVLRGQIEQARSEMLR